MKTIDWEQRRYEIAKEVLPSILNKQEKLDVYKAAILAIGCTDVLIKNLIKMISNEQRKNKISY